MMLPTGSRTLPYCQSVFLRIALDYPARKQLKRCSRGAQKPHLCRVAVLVGVLMTPLSGEWGRLETTIADVARCNPEGRP